MADFTSALYLGMRHSSSNLCNWESLTTGTPSILGEPALNGMLAQKLAMLQGFESGVLGPSSLHLFWDLFGIISKKQVVLMDEYLYPIGQCGIERAINRGIKVLRFKHQNVSNLLALLESAKDLNATPIIITDGWCPQCGKPAPIKDYATIATALGGKVILDDTQTIGILGKQPTFSNPYGYEGGGLTVWNSLASQNIVAISSLAKGFGVPTAVMCGSRRWIDEFKLHSTTRVHASPVSAAHTSALAHALKQNTRTGLFVRKRLADNVSRFRALLSKEGISSNGGLFPIQTIKLPSIDPLTVLRRLSAADIKVLLLESHDKKDSLLSFCITSDHTGEDILRATKSLGRILNSIPRL